MIYVDFTKWGVVLEGGVNCLVVSVLYDNGKTFDKEGLLTEPEHHLTCRWMEAENKVL